MTDKNPQNKAEIPMNTPTAFAGTMNTVRDSKFKSRALPQTDALKARFKAGSIPLQTDFADLIDLANIGRQAVGYEGTGFGLVKDDKNRLRYDPRKIANFTYDLSPSKGNEQIILNDLFSGDVNIHKRIALLALSENIGPSVATTTMNGNSTTYTVNAVKINSDGVREYIKIKVIADKSVGKDSTPLPFEYVGNDESTYTLWYRFTLDTSGEDFSNCTLVIDPLTLAVKHITDYSSSPLDGEIISLLTFYLVYNGVIVGDGLQVDNMKIAAKVDEGKGLQVNTSGISVKAGNGIAVNSSGINVKLAKGAKTNGGEGHGTDGAISGSGGGLNLDENGLSVDAGNGIQIDTQGVSVKLAANSGLSADETDGLKITPEQMFQKGMVMMFAGTEAEMPKGWALCNGENGTPDLRDRFIVGKGSKFTGQGEGTKSTDEATVTGSVIVNNTTLTLDQIPSHSHQYNKIEYRNFGYYYGDSRQGMIDTNSSVSTTSSGGGKGHKHDATLTTNSHKHSIDPIPPHYALAFIMKL